MNYALAVTEHVWDGVGEKYVGMGGIWENYLNGRVGDKIYR